jgi:hypothetical protein
MMTNLYNLDVDMINLRGWYLYDYRTDFFGYWNLNNKDGLHYSCSGTGLSIKIFDEGELKNNEFGFGFSYAFKKKIWEEIKFPDINWNEDGEFSSKVREKFKVSGIYDKGTCLHFLHVGSTSCCFPQYHLPSITVNNIFPDLNK